MGCVNILISSSYQPQIGPNFTNSSLKFQSLMLQKLNKDAHFINFKWRKFMGVGFKANPICCKGLDLIDFEERTSANEVKEEIERCYELIHRLGRGVVYFGSARPDFNHPHFTQVLELSKQIASLLECTTWTGAGPGLMDAAIKGAMQAGKPVGGFKIDREAGQWSSTGLHRYLPPHTYVTCRFFSARKHGFVDAAVRNSGSDRTAVIALPGGIGTLDEVFEILALIQLQRIGSQFPVPILLMNYDGYYSKLLDFLDECERWGTIRKGEVDSIWKVCVSNEQALTYLAEFYGIPLRHEAAKDHQTTIA